MSGDTSVRTGWKALVSTEIKPVALACAVGVGVLCWVAPTPAGLPDNAWHLFAIFVATVVAIISKAAPMGTIAIAAMALCAGTQVLAPGDPSTSAKVALSGFSDSVVWLIVSAFLVARSVIDSGLGRRMALGFVSIFGRSTLGLAYGLGLTDLVLSPFIPSNTARAGGIIYPVTKSICQSHEDDGAEVTRGGVTKRRNGVGNYLMLTGYTMNLAASTMFLTGAAPNAMAVKLAGDQGTHLSWGGWLSASVLPSAVGFALVPLIVYVFNKPDVRRTPEAPAAARAELRELGRMTTREWITLAVFVLLIGLWVGGGSFISATPVALVGLAILLITGALSWRSMLAEHAAWDTLTWFAALVMMGTQLNEVGFVGWFGKNVSAWLGHLGLGKWLAFVLLAAIYALSHYLFASGTAHTASMFAVFYGVGLAIGLPAIPTLVFLAGIPTMFGCLTHYGNGPAPVFYGSGYVDVKTWWITGTALGLMFLVVWSTIGVAWWHIIGVW